jgi:hypothetical protein
LYETIGVVPWGCVPGVEGGRTESLPGPLKCTPFYVTRRVTALRLPARPIVTDYPKSDVVCYPPKRPFPCNARPSICLLPLSLHVPASRMGGRSAVCFAPPIGKVAGCGLRVAGGQRLGVSWRAPRIRIRARALTSRQSQWIQLRGGVSSPVPPAACRQRPHGVPGGPGRSREIPGGPESRQARQARVRVGRRAPRVLPHVATEGGGLLRP